MNNVSLLGRLVKDPELRYIQSGQAITRITLAVDRDYSKQQKQEAEAKGRQTADFISLVAFGKVAEFCANYLEKGNRASVQGRITTGSYVNEEGKTVYTTHININSIKPIDWKKTDNKTNEYAEFGSEEYEGDIPF